MKYTPQIIELADGLKCVSLEDYKKLERECDEAREDLKFRRGFYKVQEQYLNTATRQLDEAREQNAKLRDIAERLFRAGVGRIKTDDWRTLRAEINKLKEGAK
jgi:hypothetical protein